MTDQAIEIKDFKFRYRGTKELALDGITLNIAKGEFLVLMGASEAGKSTLCASMNGLIPHYQRGKIKGTISILGRDTQENKVADMAEFIGMVFQDFEAQLFSTNVELEIAFGPENFAVEREEIGRRIKTLISDGDLSEEEGVSLLQMLISQGKEMAAGAIPHEADVERVLSKRGIPTSSDLERISSQLDELTAKLDRLQQQE